MLKGKIYEKCERSPQVGVFMYLVDNVNVHLIFGTCKNNINIFLDKVLGGSANIVHKVQGLK